MAKPNVDQIVAANLKALMEKAPALDSGPKLKKVAKVAQKTISNVLNGRHDTRLSTLAKLAEAFELEPYQLLMPIENEDFVKLIRAYNTGDTQGRRLLTLAADTALGTQRDERTRNKFARKTDD